MTFISWTLGCCCYFYFMVRNFRQPADRDFSMLRFFGLRGCMNYDLGFLCLTRPAFTRLPWRITPCPCVNAWASLAVFIILTASKPCEIRIAKSRSAGCRKFLTLWCYLKNQNMQALGLHILECFIHYYFYITFSRGMYVRLHRAAALL